MTDLIREAPIGQLIRFITKNKFLKYPEELDTFKLPPGYATVTEPEEKLEAHDDGSAAASTESSRGTGGTDRVTTFDKDIESHVDMGRTLSQNNTEPYTEERLEVEEDLAFSRTRTEPIVPEKAANGTILVDWYTTDDRANPQNWSNKKRGLISLLVCAYTFVVYSGSAIYTSSEQGVMAKFHVSTTGASLPLSLYVLAYGIGPLLWAPLSEIPLIGRSPVYTVTFLLFTFLSLPTALVDNFAGLLVLRFLQGFFGSPCLANGAATIQDMYPLLNLPYALTAWVAAAYCGPALGPLISGFAVTEEGWRWSLWEILWAAAPVCILMVMFLPETSTPNILLRRARRLRALTGNNSIQSASEVAQRRIKPSAIAMDALIKPIEITVKDPAIAFVNLFTALVYGIYYSFFEVFPLVYPPYYGFSLGMVGVVFTCVLISCGVGIAMYTSYLYFYLVPDIKARGFRAQEHRLVPALIACFGPPVGLFVFGWTANPSVHWIAPTIGIVIYGATVFVVMQVGEHLDSYIVSGS